MRTEDRVHELFLNYACNAKCPFCYNPPITPELLRLELSFDEAARSLYAAAKGGARRLNLHGGEVTLRDDLPKLLRLARKLGFSDVTLVTNGVRLSEEAYVSELADAGLTHVRLSLHGAQASTHDAVVAIPGAFERALAGARHARARGLPLGLNFVLIRSNHRELPEFVERFCLKDGVDDLIVYFPHLRGMMALNAGAEGLTYAEAAPSVDAAMRRLSAAGRRAAILLANFTPCVLPEHQDRMIDWAHEGGASAQTHPEGFTEDILEMKGRQRAPAAACAACALNERCRGVESEYLSRHGDAELKALGAPCP
jgi:sulfatase maturation enzyme AslB (radical SAM superfamily)